MMNKSSTFALVVGLSMTLAGGACAKRVDLEKVPVGTAVEVTRQDGGVVTGTLAARDETSVRINAGTATRSVPRDQIVDVRLVNEKATALPAAAKFREYTIPAGTRLALRLESAVSSESSQVGDAVQAALTQAVVVDGIQVLPAGSVVTGEVAAVRSAPKVNGRASLAILFSAITVAGPEGRYPIAARFAQIAPTTRKKDIATVALPAAGGAILGAIFGGKKGAGIGTAVGGGAGAAVVLSTEGPEVRMPVGTSLSPTLDQSVEIRVPIRKV
jgi:hypothetical protein